MEIAQRKHKVTTITGHLQTVLSVFQFLSHSCLFLSPVMFANPPSAGIISRLWVIVSLYVFWRGGGAKVNGVSLPPSSGFASPACRPTELGFDSDSGSSVRDQNGHSPYCILSLSGVPTVCGWVDRSCACTHAGNCKHICINTHSSFLPFTVAPSREYNIYLNSMRQEEVLQLACLLFVFMILQHFFYNLKLGVEPALCPVSPHPPLPPSVFPSTHSHPTPERVEGLPCPTWPHVCRVSQSIWVRASPLRARARAGQGLVWPATRPGVWADWDGGGGGDCCSCILQIRAIHTIYTHRMGFST